jgi:hypothetical protein
MPGNRMGKYLRKCIEKYVGRASCRGIGALNIYVNIL